MEWLSVRNKLSQKEVESILKKHKLVLPKDYCESVGSMNGGALINAYYLHPTKGEIPYSRNLNLCDEIRGNAFDIYRTFDDKLKQYFPFGSVGNGDYFCFDLNNNQIVLYEHEIQRVCYVCDSYTDFLEKLVAD